MAAELLLQPIEIKGLKFKNRLVHAPTTLNMSDPHGYSTRRSTAAYASFAQGGFGAVCVGATCVRRDGLINERMLGLYDEDYVIEFRDTVTEIKNCGALAGIQLFYGGLIPGLGATIPLEGNKGWIPDTIAWGPSNVYKIGSPNPEVVPTHVYEEIVEAFGQAARRAQEAGFDYVSFHFCHGSLPHTNLSLLSNQGRTDRYADHFQFCEEIIQRTQELCGKDYPLIPRLCCDENLEGGYDIEYFAEHFAPRLHALGIAALDATFGSMLQAPSRRVDRHSNEFIGPWFHTPKVVNLDNIKKLRAELVKRNIDMPLMGSANLITPDDCRAMVEYADFAAVSRLSIDDPQFPNKLMEGREDEVRKSTHTGASMLQGNIFTKGWAGSAQNASFGREDEYKIVPTNRPKRIMVIGGGSGGLEYAITAAEIGHEVKVFEASPVLGGTMSWAANLPNIPNIEMIGYQAEYHRVMMAKLGVPFVTSVTATMREVDEYDPDITVIATGASAIVPDVLGMSEARETGRVLTLNEYLASDYDLDPSETIIVYGAGEGCELAVHLALGGVKVRLIEPAATVTPARYFGARASWIFAKLKEMGIAAEVGKALVEVNSGSFVIASGECAREEIRCEKLILSCGRSSNDSLVAELRDAERPVQVIGDAKEIRGYANAIHEAAYLVRQLDVLGRHS